MEFIEDYDFNQLVSEFKKLPLVEKKQYTIREIKSLMAMLNAYNSQFKNNSQILFNREVIDINDKNCNEEDFVEALYVYIFSLKELVANTILGNDEIK